MIVRLCLMGVLISCQVYGQSGSDSYANGQQAIAQYQFDQAIRAFYNCHQQEPDRKDCLHQLAWCHQQMGNFQDARIYYRAFINLDTLDPTGWISLGILDEQSGHIENAIKSYAKAVKIDSTNAYFLKKFGQAQVSLGNITAAIGAFQNSLYYNARDLETAAALADGLIQIDALDQATTVIQEGLALNKKDRPLLRLAVRLANRQELPDQTVMYGQQLLETGDSTLYYTTITGQAYVKLDSTSVALYLLDWVCHHDRASELAHYYYALALEASGQPTEAIHHMEIAIEKGQSDYLYLFQEQGGRLHLMDKNFKAAIQAYEAAERLHPDPEHIFQIGRAYDQWYKDKAPAMRYYENYLSTKHQQFAEYAKQRLLVLRADRHQQGNK